MAERERELVFIGVPHPDFDAGHPIHERDDNYGDEVNEWEIFAHDRPSTSFISPNFGTKYGMRKKNSQDLPEVETIGLTRWPDDVSFEVDCDGPGQNDQEEWYGDHRSQPREIVSLHDTNRDGSEEKKIQ